MKRTVSPEPKKVKRDLAGKLLAWYDKNRRVLPWRALAGVTADPYHVWLSEIMLQQTTVVTVVPYYQKFLRRWPEVQDLAEASLDEVMQMWAGLGYYRRARGLHQCARLVCAEHGGRFPESETELLKLPGFGAYTTAAILTIAFNRPANVVDGNVERVVARLFALRDSLPKAKTKLRDLAATLLPKSRYGDYAQALMDLGSAVCTPRSPKCNKCPWIKACEAYRLGIAEELPTRIKPKTKPVRRAVAFVLFNKKGEILLRQRPPTGLLGGMMEIPSSAWVEGKFLTVTEAQKQVPFAADLTELSGIVKHVFSHFELELTVVVGRALPSAQGKWVALDRLEGEALPSVMRKIVRHARDVL